MPPSFPEPQRGLIIRYGYLWHHEKLKGQTEAPYPHPCMILSIRQSPAQPRGGTHVWVLPITHTPQREGEGALEIPPALGKKLGLDDRPCWLVTNQWNDFDWPGPDLVPFERGPKKGQFVYGEFDPRDVAKIMGIVKGHVQKNTLKPVQREDVDVQAYRSTKEDKPRE